jgi:cysteine desulfurase
MRPHPGLLGRPIYLDYNATTPVDPAVAEAALPYLQTHFGNPSGTHAYADRPRQALTAARQRLANLLGCTPSEVVFTGSGSEADTLAIHGSALALRGRGDHIITQATEHPAVMQACRAPAERHGSPDTDRPVARHGQVDPATLAAAITTRTVLVSIQHANSETGTIQPIRELAEVAHAHGVLVHSDAAQSVGKVPVAVDELGVDLLTVVGHKLYAPKGVGALYVRDGVPLAPVIFGGGQERGLRAGTENVALIAALGVAAAISAERLGAEQPRLRVLRDRLHQRLVERLPDAVYLNGHPTQRLPNTLNVSIDGVIGQQLLAATPQLAASTGAACHAADPEPSGVLLAMGLPRERALGALRLTLGRWTTQAEVDSAARLLAAAVTGLRHRRTAAQHADGRPDEPARTLSTEQLNTLVGG